MGTAIKHPVPDRVKPSFVIFDIRALWGPALSVRVPGCHMATVGVRGLSLVPWSDGTVVMTDFVADTDAAQKQETSRLMMPATVITRWQLTITAIISYLAWWTLQVMSRDTLLWQRDATAADNNADAFYAKCNVQLARDVTEFCSAAAEAALSTQRH